MDNKHTLHFDPIAEAAKVDPRVNKPYEMPYKGQTFIQLHQNGCEVVVGACIGVKVQLDREGNVTGWAASIDSGFSERRGISKGQQWRDASEWHPAPRVQMETAQDARDIVEAIGQRVDAIVERLKRPTDVDESRASAAELADVRSTVNETLAALALNEASVTDLRDQLHETQNKVGDLSTILLDRAAEKAVLPDIVPQPASAGARVGRFVKKEDAAAATRS